MLIIKKKGRWYFHPSNYPFTESFNSSNYKILITVPYHQIWPILIKITLGQTAGSLTVIHDVFHQNYLGWNLSWQQRKPVLHSELRFSLCFPWWEQEIKLLRRITFRYKAETVSCRNNFLVKHNICEIVNTTCILKNQVFIYLFFFFDTIMTFF